MRRPSTQVAAVGKGVNLGDDDCLGCAATLGQASMALPLPGINDLEGTSLSKDLPPVIDAHVHLFPPKLFDAIWRWFDVHGWPIRYKLYSEAVVQFLVERGVKQMVALHYAHKRGIARTMNEAMIDLVRRMPTITGLATFFPGEPEALLLVRDAFDAGLRGIKLHCHVQCMAPDDPSLLEIYALSEERGLPVVIHAGREPKSAGYKCDIDAICAAERIDRVLQMFPKLKLCVPHLGADEFDGYEKLLEKHENLWLDTTMMLAGYFPIAPERRLLDVRPERVLYGSDFPNLPYAWDREIRRIEGMKFSEDALEKLLSKNAAELFGVSLCP